MRKNIWLPALALTILALCIAKSAGAAEKLNLLDIDEYWTAADVEAAIRAGADVNARDEESYTALMYAVTGPAKEVAEALIASGADVNARNDYGMTALMLTQMFSMTSHWSPEEMTDILVKAGADVNIKDNDGMTALLLAADQSFAPHGAGADRVWGGPARP